MSKIIVYSRPSFEGRSAEFMYDVSNLAEKGFDNSIASIKVIGEPWVAYYDKKFAGKQQVFEQGEYATFEDKDKFSSLKKVTADLTDPEIQLFEHVNYGGRSVILRKETNLQEITFSNIASSHKVTRGVWVLYDGINRQGFQLIAFPGEQVSNYGALCFNNKASCVRPLLPRP
ncbi:hypothetical protein R3I94_008696 [Phoxinus phoxinus]|uniref:Beta/gamma crystallin 'Greek key' domain-containing protein n=1 Tax=Phoxinus phoxinus TaxID=58324 RepID=A0AAN9GVZ7_9TELE